MTNEEEQAIEKLKGFKYFLDQSGIVTINTVVELINKQQKEIYELKEQIEVLNGTIEKVCNWEE